jgi:hypothetical protein
MPVHRRALVAVLALIASGTVRAQAPADCDPRQSPPGTSGNGDVSRSFCSITRRPMPLELNIPSTMPHWTGSASVHAMLVVTSYGTVDRRLTRPWSCGGGPFGVRGIAWCDSILTAVAQFRFTPGFAGDTAVRVALGIDLVTRGAPDTVPAVGNWRYVVGSRGGDTLYLDWTAAAALPVGTPTDIGAAIAVAIAELRVTELRGGWHERDAVLWTGCSAVGAQIPQAPAVQVRLRGAGVALAGEGSCAPLQRRHAVEWTRAFRIAPSVWMLRFVAPNDEGGKCRVERLATGWTAACA